MIMSWKEKGKGSHVGKLHWNGCFLGYEGKGWGKLSTNEKELSILNMAAYTHRSNKASYLNIFLDLACILLELVRWLVVYLKIKFTLETLIKLHNFGRIKYFCKKVSTPLRIWVRWNPKEWKTISDVDENCKDLKTARCIVQKDNSVQTKKFSLNKL